MSSSRLYMRILFGVIICLGHIHISPLKAFAQTWCVANPSLGYDTSENVESYACNYVDCSSIHSGDPCSVPSNLFSRASFAMNAYYQQGHDCKFGGSGLKSITDPSYGNCKFVGSEEMISAPAALSKWCIAKPTAPYSLLQMNIDFACSQVDCSVIQTGGECQLLDTIMNHASVAMNLYYQSFGRTDLTYHFKSTGMIVIDDPSFGTCLYKRKGKEGGAGVSLVKKHGKSSVILKLIVALIITFGLVGTVTVVCVCQRSRNPSQAIKSEMQHMPTPAPSQSQRSVTVSVPLSPPPDPSQTQPKKDNGQLDIVISGNQVNGNKGDHNGQFSVGNTIHKTVHISIDRINVFLLHPRKVREVSSLKCVREMKSPRRNVREMKSPRRNVREVSWSRRFAKERSPDDVTAGNSKS